MKRKINSLIIKFIVWFLENRCGGAFHCRPYGELGRYVVIMTDKEYHDFQWKVR
jgi:hypothetical protein